MDMKKIKALAELLDKYSLTELDYTEGDSTIKLQRGAACYAAPRRAEPLVELPDEVEVNEPVITFSDVTEITAPLVGVFYSSPSPDSAPYVKVGSKVRKGDILCIVEAMKLMNEITSDMDGEIVDICVENGQIVEFGQTLFKII